MLLRRLSGQRLQQLSSAGLMLVTVGPSQNKGVLVEVYEGPSGSGHKSIWKLLAVKLQIQEMGRSPFKLRFK